MPVIRYLRLPTITRTAIEPILCDGCGRSIPAGERIYIVGIDDLVAAQTAVFRLCVDCNNRLPSGYLTTSGLRHAVAALRPPKR
jgi:hypothetical protein